MGRTHGWQSQESVGPQTYPPAARAPGMGRQHPVGLLLGMALQ